MGDAIACGVLVAAEDVLAGEAAVALVVAVNDAVAEAGEGAVPSGIEVVHAHAKRGFKDGLATAVAVGVADELPECERGGEKGEQQDGFGD